MLHQLSPEEYARLKADILDELRNEQPHDREPDEFGPDDSDMEAESEASSEASLPRKSSSSSLDWAKQRAAAAQKRLALTTVSVSPPVLAPVRHPQRDFFIADILDLALKDDIASMEHPLFALKAGDKRVRTYQRGGVSVVVKPGFDGCATIHDKDVWIYCVSQLIEAMNRSREVSRTVRFTAHDFLVTTNRRTDGDSYQRMAEAMSRLAGTRIETNLVTADMRDRQGFGLLDSWRVIEKTSGGRMVAIEATLPDWLYRSVQARQVLTLSPDYFRIRKPLNRRIYELARKHCGAQRQWQCKLETLYLKSGSTDALRNFRGAMRTLANANELPDYEVRLDDSDLVTIVKRR